MFDYQFLIDEAMLEIVKKIFTTIEHSGIRDGQSFYVSIRTNSDGVVLSKRVREKYPKEITIVLEHQFRNLAVLQDKFVVNISFNNIAETIEVPFDAIVKFLDPAANFGFHFVSKKPKNLIKIQNKAEILDSETKYKIYKKSKSKKINISKNVDNVVDINQFRKNLKDKNNN